MSIDWDALPRLLQDLCDGHPGYALELYALDLPNGRLWLCKRCWLDRAIEGRRAK